MKKIFLTAITLSLISVASSFAEGMTADTLVDITYKSFEKVYNDPIVSKHLNVSKAEFDAFLAKMKQQYWKEERNVYHIAPINIYYECANHFVNKVNKRNEAAVAAAIDYCTELPWSALKYQMEEQQATKGNKTSQSDAYSFLKSLRKVYPAGNIKGSSPASATEKLFRQDCLKEVLKKNGCTNTWASISQVRTVLVCDGSTVSLEQLDASAQNAVKFCEKEPVLPQNTRDGWVCTFN